MAQLDSSYFMCLCGPDRGKRTGPAPTGTNVCRYGTFVLSRLVQLHKPLVESMVSAARLALYVFKLQFQLQLFILYRHVQACTGYAATWLCSLPHV